MKTPMPPRIILSWVECTNPNLFLAENSTKMRNITKYLAGTVESAVTASQELTWMEEIFLEESSPAREAELCRVKNRTLDVRVMNRISQTTLRWVI